MNSTISYMPNGDNDRKLWLDNFNSKLPLYASRLGISAADLDSLQKDTAMYTYIMTMLNLCRKSVMGFTAYKNQLKHAYTDQVLGEVPVIPVTPAPDRVPQGLFDRISFLVKRIKASSGYSDPIGGDLRILTLRKSKDPATLKPILKITLSAGVPHVKSNRSYGDAIDLYADHHDGKGYVFVVRLVALKYTDLTPVEPGGVLTEWSYKAIFVKDDKQVGLMSDDYKVVVRV